MSKQPAGVSTGSGAQELPVLPAREKEKKQVFGTGETTKYTQEIFFILQQHPHCPSFS